MGLFESVFDKQSIYNCLFFNVKSVLEHPTLDILAEKNPALFDRWKYVSEVKYNASAESSDEEKYKNNAINHPEFCKIVAITYSHVFMEGSELKRQLNTFSMEDEALVIDNFMDILHRISSEDSKSYPQSSTILCGHNVISNDIPMLIKRFVANREKFTNKKLPYIIRQALDSKPWESSIIDTVNVWKFNGFDYSSLMLIADFLNLKKTTTLLTNNELSKYYWDNINENSNACMKFISLQSATQVNLVIQIMVEMRKLS